MTEIKPLVEVNLVFPEEESHFSVSKLSKLLSNKFKVNIHQSCYLHGFMNPHSINYNPSGYKIYLQWLTKKITNISL